MDWSPKQRAALDSVQRWLEEPNASQVFRLFGYAGSGKTTLARHFAEGLSGRVLFGAFTGKAALVLQSKGCRDATTIHRMIYLPKNKSAVRLHELQEKLAKETDADRQRELHWLIQKENENLSRPSFSLNIDSDLRGARLVIIDEVSMVGEQMGQDLLSFEAPILVLGDTAQLPPVAEGGFFTKSKPEILLDEIHRQAAESPVIRLATTVREGRGLERGTYSSPGQPDSFVLPKGQLKIQDLAKFDQILVGKNATRKLLNDMLRTQVYQRKSHLPEPGDRLVCLRNNHENGLLNGSLWDVLECITIDDDTVGLTLKDPDSESELGTVAHRHHFEGREKDLAWWQKREADEFDFGFVLTVHKAQGSQWRNVVVVDESNVFRQDSAKWLYTGITRAASSVTVLR